VGFTPSPEDLKVFNSLNEKDISNKFAHLRRWYTHIQSFSPQERERFGHPESFVEEPIVTKKEVETGNGGGDEDELDFFSGTSQEDEQALKDKMEKERLEKLEKEKLEKGKKKKPVEKSNIIMHVKPKKAKTSMVALEEFVRSIQMDGLDWKLSELVEIAYGVQLLKISCNIVDELVSVDDLEEILNGNEELVSSVEIQTFTKIS